MLSPSDIIENNRLRLDNISKSLINAANRLIKEKSERFSQNAAKLDALSPLKVMARGFALPTDNGGRVIKTVSELDKVCEFKLRLSDGSRKCIVKGEK